MNIFLYNTLSNSIEKFIPIDQDNVTLYVCGPTIYDTLHIGNYRSIIVYDMLYRLLNLNYNKVTYIRNITDIDDKIINAAKAKNIPIDQLTAKVKQSFIKDLKLLNALSPTYEPCATQHISQMIKIIKSLLDNNHAYVSNKHVYFSVESYADYGKLSKREIDSLKENIRIEESQFKKSQHDFILWKPVDANEDDKTIFDSPWGKGRPGWHIECSAMSIQYLGSDFDIHGGGVDLKFPHHENEIAQSICAFPNSNFAKYWVHNGFLTVEGKKMSKSLNNFLTVQDLLNEGYRGVDLRYCYLTTHYRKPINFTYHLLKDAKQKINELHQLINKSSYYQDNYLNNKIIIDVAYKDKLSDKVKISLNEDMNFSQIIAILNTDIKELRREYNPKKLENLVDLSYFLGLIDSNLLKADLCDKKIDLSDLEKNVSDLVFALKDARQNKNFEVADNLKKKLLAQGYQVRYTKNNEIEIFL